MIKSEIVSVSKIKPNPNNPRLIKDEQYKKLVQSVKDLPEMIEVREIVVNKDMVILGGNMRFRAMQEAGWKEVPVRIVDWPEEKQREFIIKDNVSGGEWDWDILANEWDTQQLDDWGIEKLHNLNTQRVNEQDEWTGMPDFDPKDPYYKIVLNFENREDMEKYAEEQKYGFLKKMDKCWTTQFPFDGERQDLNALKYE